MDVSLSAWFVILLAAFAANLPFLNNRLLLLVQMKAETKPFWIRLLELSFWYAVTGIVAYVLESRIGAAFPQGWQFFVITGCLFLVLAFPGFVYRYLFKHKGRA